MINEGEDDVENFFNEDLLSRTEPRESMMSSISRKTERVSNFFEEKIEDETMADINEMGQTEVPPVYES